MAVPGATRDCPRRVAARVVRRAKPDTHADKVLEALAG